MRGGSVPSRNPPGSGGRPSWRSSGSAGGEASAPFGFSLGQGRPSGNAFGGCYIQDMLDACTLQGSSGALVSCVQHTTDCLQGMAVLTAAEAKAINAWASQ